MNEITAERYHDISCGHRVVGHEGKCRFLHGHNYRIHFVCAAMPGVGIVDEIGRVIDFSVIKSKLCMWLEDNWDHKFLHWEKDTLIEAMIPPCGPSGNEEIRRHFLDAVASLVELPFNPTAENMAEYLVETVAPLQLEGTAVEVIECRIEETRKCTATYRKQR